MLCHDIREWAKWMQDHESRILQQEDVGDARVSTVFLGVDHDFAGTGRAVLWETMIFGGPLDGEQWRYSSRQEAVVGHVDAVTKAIQAARS